MARSRSSYLNELSTADLKQLLAARQRIDILEKDKARLLKELALVDGELKRLVAGVEKPAAVKKSARKTTRKTPKKAAVKKAAKKVTRKTSAAKAVKKTSKKAAKKTGKKTSRKVAAKPRLEDIVVGIIKGKGKPVSYQDILTRIKEGKLFKSKSSNFDNVLRRTLSTSKKVKRAGRGIYDID